MEQMIEGTIECCKQCNVFGHPILGSEVVQLRLAEQQMEVEALYAFCYRATGEYCCGSQLPPTVLGWDGIHSSSSIGFIGNVHPNLLTTLFSMTAV